MGSEGIDLCIIDLGTSCRCVVTFTLRPLCPRERDPVTHWIGILVGPRAGLNDVEKKRNFDEFKRICK
jgi:hypothetical protein